MPCVSGPPRLPGTGPLVPGGEPPGAPPRPLKGTRAEVSHRELGSCPVKRAQDRRDGHREEEALSPNTYCWY